MKDRPLRILHCPTSTAGNPPAMAQAERELGLESWAVSANTDYRQYQVDEEVYSQASHPLIRQLRYWQLLWRAIQDFDIIHFNFGQSILPQWSPDDTAQERSFHPLLYRLYKGYARLFELRDLPLLKKMGKGIVVTYQGTDARQGDYCRANFEISPVDDVEPGYFSSKSDARKRYRIAQFARYADRIYALNPDLLHVLPDKAEFLPYASVDPNLWPVQPPKAQTERLTVLHAPTHRGVKGTRYVLDAVNRLQNKDGFDFEFTLVEGLSHQRARQLYERADLLIDQLLIGWYGGLANELMALGKPVICYIRQDDLRFIPCQMGKDLPVIQATPDSIYDVLRTYLTEKRADLPELGLRSRSYAETWHNPRKIAARLKRDYEEIMANKAR